MSISVGVNGDGPAVGDAQMVWRWHLRGNACYKPLKSTRRPAVTETVAALGRARLVICLRRLTVGDGR